MGKLNLFREGKKPVEISEGGYEWSAAGVTRPLVGLEVQSRSGGRACFLLRPGMKLGLDMERGPEGS